MKFKAESDLLELAGVALPIGGEIKQFSPLLGLRKGRAESLTRRIHTFFCALAAARLHRPPEGWLSVGELGTLDGWSSSGSIAKLLANEFAGGSRDGTIVEQRGRGAESQFRLRMPASLVEIGRLPETVRRIFVQDHQTAALIEDRRPRPVGDREIALAVAEALRSGAGDGPTLMVSPLYQGGQSSLVFVGLAIRRLDETQGRPVASSVLVKVALGLNATTPLAAYEKALDDEAALLAELAGTPGLPVGVERHRVELRGAALRPVAELLAKRYGTLVRGGALQTNAMIISLGHPRTVDAEPRLLSTVIEETASPMSRLTRRNIHNILVLAERLATLVRLLHTKRRAHRHLAADAIVVRYGLGIFDHILAADLAASVIAPTGSDELLYRDLFDLGGVLVYLITGRPPSSDRHDFQPPGFSGRAQINAALIGEGETVARLLFVVGHYLLEASPGPTGTAPSDSPTVALLDHFLDEIAHLNMLHWSKARGVPERRVSFSAATTAPGPGFTAREVWARSAADPIATRLVTISHLVDVATLRRWCERYVTSAAWHNSLAIVGERSAPRGQDATPSAEDCIALLQQGFGRSAAHAMWRYLWNTEHTGEDDLERRMVRVLRNYTIHWIREDRFDVTHDLGGRSSDGLLDELARLRARAAAQPKARLFVEWIDELKRRAGDDDELRAELPAADPDRDRLRSWMDAWALLRLLRAKQKQPTEKEIHDVEVALHGRSSPEVVFWHILLARAWVATAARGGLRPETLDGESGWDRAMRALVMAAGVAASRKLPFEMAATLTASAYLTRLALQTPELCIELAAQGADEDNVRVQAAECALMAADAYQALDNQKRHYHSLIEAVRLLQGSKYSERLLQAFQLLALARNNRVLTWQPRDAADAMPQEPSADHKFIRYAAMPPEPVDRTAPPFGSAASPGRAGLVGEQKLFDETYLAWMRARGRVRTSDDPSTVVEHGYLSRYAPGYHHLFGADELHIELDPQLKLGTTIDRLFELAGISAAGTERLRILDFGCGPGDEARQLARRGHAVWAVDSPVWFATASSGPRAERSTDETVQFIKHDPVDFARRICDRDPPSGSPAEVDVVLFRCSLCRVSQRSKLLAAAMALVKPGGVVLATDWVQTRTTDRITWSRILDTMRFVDLETEPGYRQLCADTGLVDFTAWSWDSVLRAGSRSGEPPMQRFFQNRLDDTRQRLGSERAEASYTPYERAFLMRALRDLEVLTAVSSAGGPLGWLFWGARKPGAR